MAVVVAVLLLLAVGAVRGYEHVMSAPYRRLHGRNEAIRSEFQNSIENKKLEHELFDYIYNMYKTGDVIPEVWEEICGVISQLEHWSCYVGEYGSEQYRKFMEDFNYHTILKIMLANRGYVNSRWKDRVAESLIPGRGEGSLRAYELDEWIEEVLEKQGKDFRIYTVSFKMVDPHCYVGKYDLDLACNYNKHNYYNNPNVKKIERLSKEVYTTPIVHEPKIPLPYYKR